MAAYYTFEDLSGHSITSASENPYDGLLEACHDDPVTPERDQAVHETTNADNDQASIQARYDTHRTNRNTQQRAKLLAPDFPGVTPDEILFNLEIDPDYRDWRHCLVFWARPPQKVRSLIAEIQEQLEHVVPSLWFMPPPDLHMTALEITHSLTAPEIDTLVDQMLPSARDIVDYTVDHRARLIKPLVSYDAQAIALSFLPAAGESERSTPQEDAYSYHHLRRDLYAKASATGVKVASRYVIPSAHLTIARFIRTQEVVNVRGDVDQINISGLVETIERINRWLQAEYWPNENGIKDGGEWVVGEEKGLEYRKGALWYGSGGETVAIGKGS
ncbi:hypothetical protein LTR53_002991 [Teratosphaeriaceae sp. CCFEE 6253]|nr:hypothetical protein LTR53_002991 [Teratosphaeriaceae sp. CCFEE 6253]